MSAYIVSDKTITAIVEGFKYMDFQVGLTNPIKQETYYARTNPLEIGQILLNQNYKSVNYRYNESTEPHEFVMTYKTDEYGYREDYTLGEIYGCINCYMYQSCENPEWEDTEVYHALHALKDDIAEKLIRKLGDKMPWGI